MVIKKIPDQIIRKALIPLELSKIDAIAFHHSAHKSWSIKDVESYHINTNGWDAIGYNYWISQDGTIYEGRGLMKGAGVKNHNSHIISVCMQGDFETHHPTDSQYASAKSLTEYLKKLIPTIKTVGSHKDWNPTLCPGKNFNILKITSSELTSVNDIVWELSSQGIITDKDLWLKKLNEDTNAYWLARKCANKIRGTI